MLAAHQLAEGERLAISDIDFIEYETGMHHYCRILEIGCGWGRHSRELAHRGYSRDWSSSRNDPFKVITANRRIQLQRLEKTGERTQHKIGVHLFGSLLFF